MLKYLFQIFERENLQNQYLNYILMIINQNILAILNTYSICKKKSMRDFTPRRQLPKLLLLIFSAKFLKERKYLMTDLTFIRRKYP